MKALICINFPLEPIEDIIEYYKDIQIENLGKIIPFFIIAKQLPVIDTDYDAFLEALLVGTNTTIDKIIYFEHSMQINDYTPDNVYQHLFLELLKISEILANIYAETQAFYPALPGFDGVAEWWKPDIVYPTGFESEDYDEAEDYSESYDDSGAETSYGSEEFYEPMEYYEPRDSHVALWVANNNHTQLQTQIALQKKRGINILDAYAKSLEKKQSLFSRGYGGNGIKIHACRQLINLIQNSSANETINEVVSNALNDAVFTKHSNTVWFSEDEDKSEEIDRIIRFQWKDNATIEHKLKGPYHAKAGSIISIYEALNWRRGLGVTKIDSAQILDKVLSLGMEHLNQEQKDNALGINTHTDDEEVFDGEEFLFRNESGSPSPLPVFVYSSAY